MLNWLAEHWGSLIILLTLLALIVGSFVRRFHPRYRRLSRCGGCAGCHAARCPQSAREEGQQPG